MSPPIMKHGDLLSPTYLAWIRRQPCAFGPGCGPSSEAHHWPTKGSLGYTDDTSTLPACRSCHRRCHEAKIGSSLQEIQTLVYFRLFWLYAGQHERDQVTRDIARWAESRVFQVPW